MSIHFNTSSNDINWGKYNKWIVILQEFDLDFISAKSKNFLVFYELMSKFLKENEEPVITDSFPDEHLFFVSSSDPSYGYILIYLQTLNLSPQYSWDDRRWIRHRAKNYLIIDDTLYRCGVNLILCHYLTHKEPESVLNDCHSGGYGNHLSGLEIAQKILRVRYLWMMIFKYCVEVVKRCHPCHIFSHKMCAHLAPLFLVITVSPFIKWGIHFTTFHPPSTRGYCYIIMIIDYITKWTEAMPTYVNDGETVALFLFNQVITRFGVPREIVTDHGSHFQNRMIFELASKLGFKQEHFIYVEDPSPT
jgi:hypothetical protein